MDGKQPVFMRGMIVTLIVIVTISLLWVSGETAATGSCTIGGKSYCGQKSPDGCWCDKYCIRYIDCCEDYQNVCGTGKSAKQIIISAYPDTVSADGKSESTIIVSTNDKASGVKITFSADFGELSSTSCTTGQMTGMPDSKGVCSVTLKSSKIGTANVIASTPKYTVGSVVVLFAEQKTGTDIDPNAPPGNRNNLPDLAIKTSIRSKVLTSVVDNVGKLAVKKFLIEVKVLDKLTKNLEFGDSKTIDLGQYEVSPGNNNIVTFILKFEKEGEKAIITKVTPLNPSGDLNEKNNINELEMKVTSDFFFKKEADCKPMVTNGDPSKKLNIVFIPDLYTNNLNDYKQIAEKIVNGFKKTEPFKSNFNKINFYRIETPQILNSEIYTNQEWVQKAQMLAANCPRHEEIIVLNPTTWSQSGGVKGYSLGFSSHIFVALMDTTEQNSYVNKQEFLDRTVLHEFGHSFGGLYEEYIVGFSSFYLATGPNCDEKGCPKWCSGEPKKDIDGNVLHDVCNKIVKKEECVVDFEKNKACLWIEPLKECTLEMDNAMKRFDVGQGCIGGTGCYLGGCGGLGFKPSATSIMAQPDEKFIEDKRTMTEDSLKYNIPSINHLKKY